jgi:hypothetical protein
MPTLKFQRLYKQLYKNTVDVITARVDYIQVIYGSLHGVFRRVR